MDPLIAALQNATSSAQLIAAIDALPRDDKYYTAQIRDLLLQKQKFVVDSATADAVVSFLGWFSGVKAAQSLLGTPEIRDLIINVLAPQISEGDPVADLGGAIYGTVNGKPSAELYSTPESLKAILSCFHRATTAASADWVARSINSILYFNPSASEHLKDLPVVEAFSVLFPHTSDDTAVTMVSWALQNILQLNEAAQEMFGTPTFFEKFKTVKKHANSDAAKKAFRKVVDILQPIAARRVALQKPLRDATTSQELASALNTIIRQSDCLPTLVEIHLTKQHLILDEESTISTAKFIKWSFEQHEMSIQRKEIYDHFQDTLLPQSLNFTVSIPHVHESLSLILKSKFFFWVTNNKVTQAMFSTTSFKEYIVASLPHSNESTLKLLNSLLDDNKKGQEIFGTPDFKEKLENKFFGNTSVEFTAVMKLLNDQIIRVRFETLKQLAAIHKEDIPERLVQKLSEAEIDPALLLNCDSAMLLAAGAKVKEVAIIITFIKNIKNKNNGVAPIHQDPFKLFELEQLRQEHDDLRKLHQDIVISSSTSIDNLKLELENEKKNHAAATTKLKQEIANVVADRDAKQQTIDNLQNKINGLAINLADEKKRTSNLEKSLDDTKKQLQSAQQEISALQTQLDIISPFVTNKLYQIDYGILNLPQPQAGVVADLGPVPSQSRIFAEAEKMMKKSGTLVFDSTSPCGFNFSPVKGFTLQSVDVILRNAYSFEERMDRLQGLRVDLTDKFNPAFAAFSPEQQQVLKVLFEHFLPRPPNANKKFPNLVNVFHGTKIDCLDSAIKGLVAMKSTDEGFFGFGCYTTTSIEYAAKYARGDFDPAGPSPARADGCYPVLWCVAAVGVCNPVSRADDYSKNRIDKTFGAVSDFFGSPLSRNCDCHCALVGGSQSYQAVAPQNMEYLEIVVDQENQVIPIAVLWVKP